MAGTLHHRLPLLLVVFSIICSYAYSNIAHPPYAGPPFHHNDKPFPGQKPSLPPQSHGKPSPIPIHKPPRDHMKPPTFPPHPLDLSFPSSLISKSHTPPPAHEKRHPSPPGKPRYPIQSPRAHMIPPAAPHGRYRNPTPYTPPSHPTNQHRSPSPLNSKTPLHKIQISTPSNHNTNKPTHHVTPFPPSHSPHFYKSPPPDNRHGGIYTAPPPIHH